MKKRKVNRQLTERQLQILKLKASGFSGKQIAEIMGIKIKTVEDESGKLHRKLGTNNFSSSITVALKQGLLMKDKSFPFPKLSAQEKLLIKLISKGLEIKEIPDCMEGITKKTISKIKLQLIEKFKAKNICHVIYLNYSN